MVQATGTGLAHLAALLAVGAVRGRQQIAGGRPQARAAALRLQRRQASIVEHSPVGRASPIRQQATAAAPGNAPAAAVKGLLLLLLLLRRLLHAQLPRRLLLRGGRLADRLLLLRGSCAAAARAAREERRLRGVRAEQRREARQAELLEAAGRERALEVLEGRGQLLRRRLVRRHRQAQRLRSQQQAAARIASWPAYSRTSDACMHPCPMQGSTLQRCHVIA